MAVIFAVVGGGAIIGIANSDPYSDYSNHSDYSNYGNYSNYSDAAERRKRRIAAKEEEIKQGVQEVNQYKINHVNAYLKNEMLISKTGETVDVRSVEEDGNEKILLDEKVAVIQQTKSTQQEIEEIDAVIATIDRILEDKRQ
ncbi:MAG: hypothetical protein ACI4S0_00080 [Dorea sp.]